MGEYAGEDELAEMLEKDMIHWERELGFGYEEEGLEDLAEEVAPLVEVEEIDGRDVRYLMGEAPRSNLELLRIYFENEYGGSGGIGTSIAGP